MMLIVEPLATKTMDTKNESISSGPDRVKKASVRASSSWNASHVKWIACYSRNRPVIADDVFDCERGVLGRLENIFFLVGLVRVVLFSALGGNCEMFQRAVAIGKLSIPNPSHVPDLVSSGTDCGHNYVHLAHSRLL
jgi:hypothetical protein